jgi:hypothetical protein
MFCSIVNTLLKFKIIIKKYWWNLLNRVTNNSPDLIRKDYKNLHGKWSVVVFNYYKIIGNEKPCYLSLKQLYTWQLLEN